MATTTTTETTTTTTAGGEGGSLPPAASAAAAAGLSIPGSSLLKAIVQSSCGDHPSVRSYRHKQL